ncbi:MAG: hypothetical protein AB8B96_18500 [Lysobacterales bacterium]
MEHPFKTLGLYALLTSASLGLNSSPAKADALVDALGVSDSIGSYSVQLGSSPLTALQTGAGRFSSDGRMTVGLSAQVPSEGAEVSEYVLWIRHDGPRQWYIGDEEQPLTIQLEDRRLTPLPLHIARGGKSATSNPYIDTLEFALVPELVDILLAEPSVILRLDTKLGQVEKPLSESMMQTAIQLTDRVSQRPQI